MNFSLIIPFYSDIDKLLPTLDQIKKEMRQRRITEILLCHNGPALPKDSEQKVRNAIFEGVRLLHTDSKGIGAGYKLGILSATAEYVILSASDLPFGWTDLDAFCNRPCDFAIGSKHHKDSLLKSVTLFRRFLSFGFLQLRRLILGISTPGDSQGSFIVKTRIAQSLTKESQFNNYLFSLELATLHLKKGGNITELPISVVNNDGESSVSVASDSIQMLKDLLKLRKSLK